MDPTPAPDPSSPPFPPADVPTRPRSALGGAARDLAEPSRAAAPTTAARAAAALMSSPPRALPQDHAPLERPPLVEGAPLEQRAALAHPAPARAPFPPRATLGAAIAALDASRAALERAPAGDPAEEEANETLLRRAFSPSDASSSSSDDDDQDEDEDEDDDEPPSSPPSFHAPPPPDFDAAWASHAPSPMDAAVDGVAAAREAWVCCDAPGCGKWRRVPSLVARMIGETDVWRCADGRDARFSSCASAQELGDDEIDRRVNAAAAAEREALLAQAAAERELQKRLKKRRLDAEYRERKRQKKALERREARIAAGLPPDSPPRAPKPPKPPKPAKPPKPQKPPPPPPKPPRFYPETFIRCESAACGKWRRVPRRVKSALCPARDRWTCAFDRSPWVAPEERTCDRPSEWASDAERLEWAEAHERAEREARALGADVDGDEGVGAESRGDGGSRGGKKGSSSSGTTTKGGPHGGGGGGDDDGFDPSLPRGTVSGADALTEADEDAHEDPGRVDPSPRSMPPAPPRGVARAAVPATCGGVYGVFLPRTAEFRCMCDESRENCAGRSGEGRGVVFTTTMFEKHCGMEKSKNWRNSVSVLCADEPRPIKVGMWLAEVGIDVARGKGGGPGGSGAASGGRDDRSGGDHLPGGKKKGGSTRQGQEGGEPAPRWQPAVPGPFERLPMRRIMATLEAILDGVGDDEWTARANDERARAHEAEKAARAEARRRAKARARKRREAEKAEATARTANGHSGVEMMDASPAGEGEGPLLGDGSGPLPLGDGSGPLPLGDVPVSMDASPTGVVATKAEATEAALEAAAAAEGKDSKDSRSEHSDSGSDSDSDSPPPPEPLPPRTPEDRRRELAAFACVCKAWHVASTTVAKARGVEKWRPRRDSKPENPAAEKAAEALGDGEPAPEKKEAFVSAAEKGGGASDEADRPDAADRALPPIDPSAEGGPPRSSADPSPPLDQGTAADPDEFGSDERRRRRERDRRRRAEREQERRAEFGFDFVDRKFEVDLTATRAQLGAITEYVHRGDPDEVARERAVTLADDQPPLGEEQKNAAAFSAARSTPGSAIASRLAAGEKDDAAEPPPSPSPHHVSGKHPGEKAVDRRVRVYWPEEDAFFPGCVTAYFAKTGEHEVTYDDGDVERVTLAKERMEWLEPGGDRWEGPDESPDDGSGKGSAKTPKPKPPGWWPVVARWPSDPRTGAEKRRKEMGTEVREQETYGVDYVTARDVAGRLRRVLPEFGDDKIWALVNRLMMQVNATYGAMSPDATATHSVALAAEDLATKLERGDDGERRRAEASSSASSRALEGEESDLRSASRSDRLASAKALWFLSQEARSDPDLFIVHRKGFGVVCKEGSEGVKKGDLVVDFLGEMYPPWAWMAKQDAIKTAQRTRGMRETGPPEFYNMQLERPPGDAEGFGLLFVDAMHYNNYAARLSHSCDPNVEVSLRAIDGKYCINFYAKRDVAPGEELCYNYHSCTDSMKEVEAAFCLCGARWCRASYLAFVGEQSNNHVLKRCHGMTERHAALLLAGDEPPSSTLEAGDDDTGSQKNTPAALVSQNPRRLSAESLGLGPDATSAMEEVGLRLGRGLLRDAPAWLCRYVASVAMFMRREVSRLPRDILAEHREATAKEVQKSKGAWRPPPFGLGDAEIEAMAVRENRLQSVAVCLSKVRYLLGRGPEKAPIADAPPPATRLSEREAAERFFGAGRDSMIVGLLAAMAPHARHGEDAVRHAGFAHELEDVARRVLGKRRGTETSGNDNHREDDQRDGEERDGERPDEEEASEETDANDANDGGGEGRSPAEPVPADVRTHDDQGRSPSPRSDSMSLAEGLLWLRDRLASMPPTKGARHDVAAALAHMHARTRNRWVASSHVAHSGFKADPIPVRENEVNSFGIGAEGATEKIAHVVERAYKPATAAGALLTWHKQDVGDPTAAVSANRKGCVMLPDLACAYSSRPEVSVKRAGARERAEWVRCLEKAPGKPWPANSGPWGVTNQMRIVGSPALDAFADAHASGWGTVRGGGPPEEEEPPAIDEQTMEWIKKRKSAF